MTVVCKERDLDTVISFFFLVIMQKKKIIDRLCAWMINNLRSKVNPISTKCRSHDFNHRWHPENCRPLTKLFVILVVADGRGNQFTNIAAQIL